MKDSTSPIDLRNTAPRLHLSFGLRIFLTGSYQVAVLVGYGTRLDRIAFVSRGMILLGMVILAVLFVAAERSTDQAEHDGLAFGWLAAWILPGFALSLLDAMPWFFGVIVTAHAVIVVVLRYWVGLSSAHRSHDLTGPDSER